MDSDLKHKEEAYEWLLTEPESQWTKHLQHTHEKIQERYDTLLKAAVRAKAQLDRIKDMESIKKTSYLNTYPLMEILLKDPMSNQPLENIFVFIKGFLPYHIWNVADKATTPKEIYDLCYQRWYSFMALGIEDIPPELTNIVKLQRQQNEAEWKVDSYHVNTVSKYERLTHVIHQQPRYIDPDIVYAIHQIVDNQANDPTRYRFSHLKRVLGFVFPIENDDSKGESDAESNNKKNGLTLLRLSTEVSLYKEEHRQKDVVFVIRRTSVPKAQLNRDVAVINEDGRIVFRDFSVADDIIRSFEKLTSDIYNNNFNYGMRMIGKQYGICMSCGRQLTDEQSIEFGFGAICARYWGYDVLDKDEENLVRRLTKKQKNQ